MESSTITLRRALWKTLIYNDMPTRILGAELAKHDFSAQEHAFARELLSGSIRWQIALDCIAHAHTKGRIRSGVALHAIRLGLYQLLCMNSVADHAAINETINAAKPELGKESKFVNAVLRATSRSVIQSTEALPNTHIFRAFEIGFGKAVFADSTEDPQLAAAQQYSYPHFLVKRWWQEVGEQQCIHRMVTLNQTAQIWRRNNLCKSAPEEVCEKLEIESGVSIVNADGFAAGEWAVQDITSWQTAMMAEVNSNEKVLDLCAAPGGKSFAIYEQTQGQIDLHACDINESRLAIMQVEGERLGHNLQYHQIEIDGEGVPSQDWNVVLCDVPCSNSGVFNKRAEARHRFSKKYLHEVETMQNVFRKKVLSRVVGEKTRVLYSTCSLEPEENQMMAARIAKAFSKKILNEKTFEPSRENAGGYAALIG
jgi:16S rRNA (cytosine967-C5)-methyltransferase